MKQEITPDELLNLPDSVSYELVAGELVERHNSAESSAIAALIGFLLLRFVQPRRVGKAFAPDCGYQIFPNDPNKLRKPDVSLIRNGRLPDERAPEGYVRIAPDLVVEVLSPGDTAYEIDQKVNEYLSVGVPLIWVVNPKTRTVRIHRPHDDERGPISFLTETDTITGERVLEGFSSPVAEFFRI
jgi:Uma2 family endonuclease